MINRLGWLLKTREDARMMLQRFDSEMWGLGIAGLYHLWERDTKRTIAEFNKRPARDLERRDFSAVCVALNGLGFDIEGCPSFDALTTARMIANTVKHGEGPDFRALIVRHPGLARDFGEPYASNPVDHEDLIFSVREFDAASKAITEIW